MELIPIPYVGCRPSTRETAIPWLKANIDHPIKGKAKVVSYLNRCPSIHNSWGLETDILMKPNGRINIYPNIRTDGVWVWIQSIAYWVKEYDLKLPERFVDHVMSSSFQIPEISEIEIEEFQSFHYPWFQDQEFFLPEHLKKGGSE